MLHTLLAALLPAMVLAHTCGEINSCHDCVSTSSWWPDSKCNWCPLDTQCHADVSLVNPCAASQKIHDLPSCAISDVPSQIHIALAGGSAMSVAWFTSGSSGGEVLWGVSAPDLISTTAPERSVQYLEEYGWHHAATLHGLQWNTRYFYKVGSQKSGWSSVQSFVTRSDDPTTPFRVSVFGDLGFEDSVRRPLSIPAVGGLVSTWSAEVTRSRLEKIKGTVDLIWHLGDIGYADDAYDSKPLHFQYESVYNGWINWMQNLTATRPYMVLPGNHEAECHSPACFTKRHKLSNFSAYNARWFMPAESSGGRASMWYSFDYGSVHFVSIDSETDFDGEVGHKDRLNPAGGFGRAGEQMDWLKADLAAAQAQRVAGTGIKFLLVGGHRPIRELSAAHEQMFSKYGVDIYFAGHSHSYSRGSSVNGTNWIVAGGSGCDEMEQAPEPGFKLTGEFATTAVPNVSWWTPGKFLPLGSEDFVSGRYASGVLSVNNSKLRWELLDSELGTVLDQLELESSY